MTKPKRPLALVDLDATGIQPPRPLGKHGSALWASVMAEYEIRDSGGTELLSQACSALDRAEALAARISEDGEVIYTKAGPKSHPAIKEELACRALVCRTLVRLGIATEAVKPVGRPLSGGIGWRGAE